MKLRENSCFFFLVGRPLKPNTVKTAESGRSVFYPVWLGNKPIGPSARRVKMKKGGRHAYC